MHGKIVKLNKDGGWGFINSPKEKPFTKIFFHWTALKPSTLNILQLERGMEVEFDCVEWFGKGWRAINIEVVNPIPEADVERI